MKDNNLSDTLYIKDEISKCEDIEELEERIFPMIHSQQEEWSRKIVEILDSKKCKKTEFAKLCRVSRISVDKWCKGSIPKNRETFLRIGMAAGYDIEKTNQLLQRYGRYPALYSKSLEDCVCIYVINHDYEDKIGKYEYIIERIKKQINLCNDVQCEEDVSTTKFNLKLINIQDEDELEKFIINNASIFANAYRRFYAYVKMIINANYMEPLYAGNVYEMAQIQGWSSSLRQCVSAIRQNKWYPTRNKIISLGLHLSMDHEQIDEMLELAHMEKLCAKNIFESVIMFILDDASLNDILEKKSENYDPDELCNYARKVLTKLKFPDFKEFLSELPEVEDAW